MRLTDVDPLPSIAGHAFARTYNSDEQIVALFGRGWTTIFERRLIVDSSGGVSIISPTNEAVTFRNTPSGWRQVWPTARPPFGTLQYNAGNGTYTYRGGGSQEVAVFNASTGNLLALRDLATGREAQIAYDTNGLPATLTDSWSGLAWILTIAQRRVTSISVSGRPDLLWTYQYDGNGNLVTVLAPGNAIWRTYEYSANRMTASRDALGNLIESHTFDAYGWSLDSTGNIDEIANIEYALPGSTTYEKITRVTFKTGAIAEYTFRPSGSAWRVVRITGGCASCGSGDATFVRDDDGRIVREQSADGYVTERTYANDQLVAEERFLQVAGCNPQTDINQCRIGPDALAGATLTTTSATLATIYEYADPLWPDRATAVQTPSIHAAGENRRTVQTLHPQSGMLLTTTTSGWTGATPIEEQHVVARQYYGDVPPCDAQGNGCTPADAFVPRFDPAGMFLSSWLALPQPSGVMRSIDGPRVDVNDVTSYVYYPINANVSAQSRGRLAAVKNALGHITRFEDYDVFGNVTRVVDANGVATESTYDALGRALTSTVKGIPSCDTSVDALCATDLTTTRVYASVTGPLQSEQNAGGAVSTYAYDNRGRIASISRGPSTSDLRERIETTYDTLTGKKNMERRLAFEGGTWVEKTRESFAYDVRARLQTATHADGAVVHYSYDAADRAISLRDENHASPNTFYGYDAAGHVVSVTQTLASAPTGAIVTRYTYDTHGNLTSVTDPNSNVTTYTFDDFGQMLAQSSLVTGATINTYDVAGDLLTTTDANGATTTRIYDALGRPSSSLASRIGLLSETTQWQYDDATTGRYGVGRLTQMTDATGQANYYYQRRGQLRREERQFSGLAGSYAIAFRYDANGNRSGMTYPSGMSVSYGYDFANRPFNASASGGGAITFVSSASYLPFGPLTSLVFGNGTTQTMSYDSRYRITQNKLTAAAGTLAQYDYGYDAIGNITSINDAQDAGYNRSFAYDDLNRLVTANTGANLWLTGSYSYDAMGNMVSTKLGEIIRPPEPGDALRRLTPRTESTTLPLGRVTTFAYAGSTPKLATVTNNDLERPVTYDAAGNETSYGVQRTYSPRNLLASVVEDMEGTSHRINYGYDGRGIRVRRSEPPATGGDSTRYFIYSPELQLLATTYDDAPNPWLRGPRVTTTVTAPDIRTEIVWFGNRPLAQIVPGISASLTFADHLGTPILQTNAVNQTVQWRAEYEPFGNIYEMRVGNRTDQPLRFPGQEVAMTLEGQEENYNVFRWYRSGWGRYTQADPIGLSGGINNYIYASASPIQNQDPLGLYAIVRDVEEIPMAHIRGTCPGLGSACTLGYRAIMLCDCDCDGSVAVTLKISGRMYVYPGNPRALGNARPFDRSVRDAASAVAHEWGWHLDAGIRFVDPFIREFERRAPFSSQEECSQTCGMYSSWVNSQFAHAVALTQTLERRRQDPRDVQ